MIIMLNVHRLYIRNKFQKCVNARPNCKARVFYWRYICPCKGVRIGVFIFKNIEAVTWRGRGAGVKNKIQADDLQRLAPQEKVASPGQPSIDRTWWNKFKNFVSTRAQNAKDMFFCWTYICPCKGYNHICSASPTKKVTWRGQGARVKNKFQGAGPFFGWIHADDLQRLAPQEKSRITRPTIHR